MRLIDADAMLKRLESWNTKDRMDKALYNFAHMRIMEQPTISQWIPVSERLPLICEWVIFSDKSGGIEFGYMNKSGGWENDDGWWKASSVTAWMPLPEPYKESESND